MFSHTRYRNLGIFVLFPVFVVTSRGNSQQLARSIPELVEKLDSYLPAYIQSRSIPGFQIALAVGDSIIYDKAFGYSRRDSVAMTDSTIMRFASNSKRITGALALRSFLQHGIPLYATARSILDTVWWSNPFGVEPTLDQLLSHQAGFDRLAWLKFHQLLNS